MLTRDLSLFRICWQDLFVWPLRAPDVSADKYASPPLVQQPRMPTAHMLGSWRRTRGSSLFNQSLMRPILRSQPRSPRDRRHCPSVFASIHMRRQRDDPRAARQGCMSLLSGEPFWQCNLFRKIWNFIRIRILEYWPPFTISSSGDASSFPGGGQPGLDVVKSRPDHPVALPMPERVVHLTASRGKTWGHGPRASIIPRLIGRRDGSLISPAGIFGRSGPCANFRAQLVGVSIFVMGAPGGTGYSSLHVQRPARNTVDQSRGSNGRGNM